MRTSTIVIEDIESTPVQPEQPTVGSNGRVSLTEMLKRNARSNNPTETPPVPPDEKEESETEETETDTGGTTEGPGKRKSATFEEDYEKFKQGAYKKISDYVENPEDLAKFLLRFVNGGRVLLLPRLYRAMLLTDAELTQVATLVKRAKENEDAGKKETEGFKNYEIRLFKKWNAYDDSITALSYTEDEMNFLAKMIAKRIKDVGVPVWLEKYDIVIAFVFIEFKKAGRVFMAKAEDFISKKFSRNE